MGILSDVPDLAEIARALVAPGKGILAADESTSTIKRRFDAIGVENTEGNRRAYRELLFRTPGIAQYVSGVILYDETIRQKAVDGTPLVKILSDQGIHPGIKADLGAKPLAFAPGEVITEGLDGLRERLAEYKGLGAVFSKWRAVITIDGDTIPSDTCIRVNAHALARYAALSQEAGIVPIVEPEVLMDGTHSIERCNEVTIKTLRTVFIQLAAQRVRPDGMLLKPNMVLSGKEASKRVGPDEVARYTVEAFRATVPAAVPGIVFLSGGQSDDEATINLDAINRYAAKVRAPWTLSFSYGRGLQAAPQKAWSGKPANVTAAQRAFQHRAKLTSAAALGKYSPAMEKEAAAV